MLILWNIRAVQLRIQVYYRHKHRGIKQRWRSYFEDHLLFHVGKNAGVVHEDVHVQANHSNGVTDVCDRKHVNGPDDQELLEENVSEDWTMVVAENIESELEEVEVHEQKVDEDEGLKFQLTKCNESDSHWQRCKPNEQSNCGAIVQSTR